MQHDVFEKRTIAAQCQDDRRQHPPGDASPGVSPEPKPNARNGYFATVSLCLVGLASQFRFEETRVQRGRRLTSVRLRWKLDCQHAAGHEM